MTEPWQCPACRTWLAPHVSEHRCEPGDGVGAKPVSPAPVTPMTTANSLTFTLNPQVVTATTRATLATYYRRSPGNNLYLRVR
jgi:hypothetical protein